MNSRFSEVTVWIVPQYAPYEFSILPAVISTDVVMHRRGWKNSSNAVTIKLSEYYFGFRGSI